MNPFFANPPGVMFLFPFSLSLFITLLCGPTDEGAASARLWADGDGRWEQPLLFEFRVGV